LGRTATFFACAKAVCQYLRFDSPYNFPAQNLNSESAIKIHKEFQEFWIFKQAKFRAKKERNVLVEMGILGDCF